MERGGAGRFERLPLRLPIPYAKMFPLDAIGHEESLRYIRDFEHRAENQQDAPRELYLDARRKDGRRSSADSVEKLLFPRRRTSARKVDLSDCSASRSRTSVRGKVTRENVARPLVREFFNRIGQERAFTRALTKALERPVQSR